MATNFDGAVAFVLSYPVFAHLEIKWTAAPLAQAEILQWKSLDPRVRFALPWNPRRPNLHGLSMRTAWTAAPARIHQQIPEPPRPAAIAQTQPQKPHLITPPHGQRREWLVQHLHRRQRITLKRLQRCRTIGQMRSLNLAAAALRCRCRASPARKHFLDYLSSALNRLASCDSCRRTVSWCTLAPSLSVKRASCAARFRTATSRGT